MAAKNGAMFNSAKCSVSKETQELLNLMMTESKLTNFQRKQLSSRLKDGKSLPVHCNPTSSQTRSNARSPVKAPTPKVMTGKHLVGSAGKRKKETIEVMSDSSPVQYKPSPGKLITAKDKRAFQNKMSYGVDIPEPSLNRKQIQFEDIPPPTPQDEFDDVLQAIEERREFLQEMEQLGQGKQYRTLIETEISQVINAGYN
ncbi:UPF0193 protein EVG1 homolog [Clytia hemisphaerica]|uniref:UPF0193 protein EVG1 homolog n=1 Tax=Clytia hemisphaerica TaxID=252671 RepID=UPI0034D5F9A6|eukprot:TCONS_00040637-protein